MIRLQISCWALPILVAVVCFTEAIGQTDSAKVTYVGNEGFLIEVGRHKVMVDALYRTGVAGYVVHPPDRRRMLERAEPPFDNVDLILATHYHADHFDPRVVGSHLVKSGQTRFVSTNQAVDELEQVFTGWKHISTRVTACVPPEGETQTVRFEGVNLTCLNLHHGRDRPIENLGFIIEIGSLRFLHIGDTEASPADMQEYQIAEKDIDLVFLPYWMLAYAEWDGQIEPTFGDANLVAMHIPPTDDPKRYLSDLGGFDGAAARIEEKYPGTIVFREPMGIKVVSITRDD